MVRGGEEARTACGSLLMALPTDANRPFPSTPPCVSMVKTWLEPLRHTTFLDSTSPAHDVSTCTASALWRSTRVTVSAISSPNPSPSAVGAFVGVLTSVPVALVIKREEKNKRIWDLREKRHKGVEKGDKAFLESLYYLFEGKKGQDTHTHVSNTTHESTTLPLLIRVAAGSLCKSLWTQLSVSP